MRGRKGRLPISPTGAVAAALGMALSASCREPTQVEIILTSRVLCNELTSAAIAVASTPARAEADFGANENLVHAPNCKRGSFGSLIITPGSTRGAVLVVAGLKDSLGTDDVRACRPPSYVGCLVARRRFVFVEGSTLRIPVSLDSSCVGVVCEQLDTCIDGVCVSSDGTASPDAGADAAPARDAEPSRDGAAPMCPAGVSACDAIACPNGTMCCRSAVDATGQCKAACSSGETLSCCNAGCPGVGEYCSAAAGGPFICSPELSASRTYLCSMIAPSCPQGMGHDACSLGPSASQGYCK